MIILINGSINAGKTTVAQQLVKLLPQTAHIEVDSLRHFIDFVPLLESIPINLENAVAVTQNFVRRGFHVVITYPLRPDDYHHLIHNLQDTRTEIHLFTLCPPLSVALTNRGQRLLSPDELVRVRELYDEGYHRLPFGSHIDNADQTPAATARAILAAVGEENGASKVL